MVWNLKNIRGSRDGVKTKVAGEKIPDDVKAFIAAEIDSLPGSVTGCRVDAYCQDAENKMAMTITRNVQLTIVGLCL